jgi:hypothetical protein
MPGSSGGPVERDEASPLEHPVEDGGGEVGVVEHATPLEPVLPCRMSERPSVTKSGPRYEPISDARRVD